MLLLSGIGLLASAAGFILVSMLLVVRPWDGNINRYRTAAPAMHAFTEQR